MLQTAHRSAFALGKTADTLLCLVGRYPYVTAEQATQLAFSRGSRKYVMQAFSQLTKAGYVVHAGRRYGIKSHYVLTTRGARHVQSMGSVVRLQLQPSDINTKSLQHLEHTSAINDVLISLELLCREYPEICLASFLHDVELYHQPVPVTLPDGSTRKVILDSWIELHIAKKWRECFGLEVDRGFYEQKRWREKIRARVAFMQGPYQEHFHMNVLRIMVHAVPGPHRRYSVADLLAWTEAELRALGAEAVAPSFCFTEEAIGTTPPHALWLTPVWSVPFANEPVSLLSLEGG